MDFHGKSYLLVGLNGPGETSGLRISGQALIRPQGSHLSILRLKYLSTSSEDIVLL